MHTERKSVEKLKTVHVGRIRSPAASLIGMLVLAAATPAGTVYAKAQTCTSTPASAERIVCFEEEGSTADIAIDASDLTINTAADDGNGIEIKHGGTGNIDVKTSDLTISTTAEDSSISGFHGIDAIHNHPFQIKDHQNATQKSGTSI